MRKTITLKDVARETGVHVSTVSRALDPNRRGRLADDAVVRIRETAERMGYRRNRLARSLRTRRTMSVGVLLPDITNTLFAPILRGAEHVLEPAGYVLIIGNTDDEARREAILLDAFTERGVDGVIDVAAHRANPRTSLLEEFGIPLVTANRRTERPDVPSVVNDDEEGIRLALRHLYDRGHRRVAHVAGPASLSTGYLRSRAFAQAAQELGLEIPDSGIVTSERFDEEEGRRCALRLLDGGWPCTAIVCANDRLALGTIDALRERGLSCPRDVSVTGFNDSPLLDRIPPGLTTIRVRQFDVGRLSAELLLKMMTDPDAPVVRAMILPVSLVERDSVAAPRERR